MAGIVQAVILFEVVVLSVYFVLGLTAFRFSAFAELAALPLLARIAAEWWPTGEVWNRRAAQRAAAVAVFGPFLISFVTDAIEPDLGSGRASLLGRWGSARSGNREQLHECGLGRHGLRA